MLLFFHADNERFYRKHRAGRHRLKYLFLFVCCWKPIPERYAEFVVICKSLRQDNYDFQIFSCYDVRLFNLIFLLCDSLLVFFFFFFFSLIFSLSNFIDDYW